jgi:hypothetical protein
MYIDEGIIFPEIDDDLDEFAISTLREYQERELDATVTAEEHRECGCHECDWHADLVERIENAHVPEDEDL